MAFRDNIAPPRKNPTASPVDVAPALASKSNQSLTTGQASKFSSPDTGTSRHNCGNQVKVQANDKGTGVAGKPSSLGNRGRDFLKPAAVNPSGDRNQTTTTYR